MPGSLYKLRCPGCGTEHEIHTGATETGVFRQFVCESCKRLTSDLATDPNDVDARHTCEACGTRLTPWSGFAGIVGAEEIVAGPCPRCGTEITKADALELGLWD